MTIKFALPTDISQITAMGYQSFKEADLQDLPYEPDFNKSLIQITNFVMDEVTLVKRDKDNEKFIDGVLIMSFQTNWYSSKEVLHSVLLYVKPNKRSSFVAKELLKAAKEYAIINKIPIVFDLFTQKDVEKKKRLLKILGFKEYGTFFVFNPER